MGTPIGGAWSDTALAERPVRDRPALYLEYGPGGDRIVYSANRPPILVGTRHYIEELLGK